MLIPSLIAQAIWFIHLFGPQLCVAMRPHGPGSSSSIQKPLDNPEAVVLQMSPFLDTSLEGTVYYVTTEKIDGKMRLQLTKTKFEALPIGKPSRSGVDLPGPLSVFTCDEDGNMEVEARPSLDLGSKTGFKFTFTFAGGKIKLPVDSNLYREKGTNLLVMKRGIQDENQYEQMVHKDTCVVGNYDPSTAGPTPSAAECKQRLRSSAAMASVASVCMPVLFAAPEAWVAVSGVWSASALAAKYPYKDLRKIRNASKRQDLVRMDLDGCGPAGLQLAGDNI